MGTGIRDPHILNLARCFKLKHSLEKSAKIAKKELDMPTDEANSPQVRDTTRENRGNFATT